jgi:hypothetical protein
MEKQKLRKQINEILYSEEVINELFGLKKQSPNQAHIDLLIDIEEHQFPTFLNNVKVQIDRVLEKEKTYAPEILDNFKRQSWDRVLSIFAGKIKELLKK